MYFAAKADSDGDGLSWNSTGPTPTSRHVSKSTAMISCYTVIVTTSVRISAKHGWFDNIRQVAPICTSSNALHSYGPHESAVGLPTPPSNAQHHHRLSRFAGRVHHTRRQTETCPHLALLAALAMWSETPALLSCLLSHADRDVTAYQSHVDRLQANPPPPPPPHPSHVTAVARKSLDSVSQTLCLNLRSVLNISLNTEYSVTL